MQTKIVPGALPDEGYVRERQIIGGRRKIRERTSDGKKIVIDEITQGVLPMSRSSWKRGQKAGRYPKGVKHGCATLYDVDRIRVLLAEIKADTER